MRQLPESAVSASGPFDALRTECRERGFTLDHITDHALGYVVEAVAHNIQIAADALEMKPRPMWVEEFCGV